MAASKLDPSKFVTHIALIVDSSASMEHLTAKTIKVFNNQLATIRRNAAAKKQKTLVSLYSFDVGLKTLMGHAEPDFIKDITDKTYIADGRRTALRDAVGLVAEEHAKLREAKDINHSFLVLTITDGQENESHKYSNSALTKKIRELQGTDRWSFVFLVPRGESHEITKMGVPDGNVQEWDTTSKGMDAVDQNVGAGLDSYFDARASGKQSTGTFFTNVADVSSDDIENLDDMSGRFFRWNVKDESAIKPFVEDLIRRDSKLRARLGGFEKGRGYYQLVKSERVQPRKDMLILDRSTNAIYGGPKARTLLGVPPGQYVNVRPGQHGNYEVFVLSTSYTRILPRGTILLYRK